MLREGPEPLEIAPVLFGADARERLGAVTLGECVGRLVAELERPKDGSLGGAGGNVPEEVFGVGGVPAVGAVGILSPDRRGN